MEVVPEVPLYEVELRGKRVEDRLTDRPLDLGTSVVIGSRRFMVADTVAAHGAGRDGRFICIEMKPARAAADELRPAVTS